MKSKEDIEQALAELIHKDYYAEDFELLSHVQAFQSTLSPTERSHLQHIVQDRLLREGSLVDVLLCSVVHVPASVPTLVLMMQRERATSQQSRAIMMALQRYGGDDAFQAVERFLDSEQEAEALGVLARMNFPRAVPHIARLIRKNQFLDPCLHILHERSKQVGVEGLADEIRREAGRHADSLRERLTLALKGKTGDYNPFTPPELQVLLAALKPDAPLS